MSKLLPSRIPNATDVVTPEIFNRLVRVVELNLGEFDPDNTRQVNQSSRDKEFFNQGAIIFNTNTDTLQCWDGTQWRDLFTSQFYATSTGYSMTSSLGTVTVSTP